MTTWEMGLRYDADYSPVGIYIKTGGYDARVTPQINSALKRLPGPVRWNRDDERWQFPLHFDVCTGSRVVAKQYGCKIDIQPSLMEWAFAERDRLAAAPDVSSTDLQTLDRFAQDYPEAYKAISSRPYQTVGAKFAAIHGTLLNADDPGLGKTLQTIAGIADAGVTGPILVVSLKSAVEITWTEEIPHWLPGDKVTLIGPHLTPAERVAAVEEAAQAKDHRHWILCGPNYLRIRAELDNYGNYKYENGRKLVKPVREGIIEMFDVRWSAVVVDESHRFLSGVTGNRKKWPAQRLGLGAIDLAEGGIRIALSGTPFRGHQHKIWGTLQWLRPDLYRSYWKWIEKHFDIYDNGFGKDIGGLVDESAFYQELSKLMIRRTKAEVAPELPPKVYMGSPLDKDDPTSPVGIWLPMTGPQAKAYRQMVKSAVANLDGGDLMANGVLAEYTRLRQLSCSHGKLVDNEFVPLLPSNKFDWVVDFLAERGIDGDMESNTTDAKVIIASQFTSLLDMFRKELAALGIQAHSLTGATSGKDRLRMKQEFQGDGGPQVFLINMNAGGASITLDAADDVILLDEAWNKDDQQQVEDRAHRISRMHNVRIWSLYSKGSIEEVLAKNTTDRDRGIKSVLDGQRGVDFQKTVLEFLKEAAA